MGQREKIDASKYRKKRVPGSVVRECKWIAVANRVLAWGLVMLLSPVYMVIAILVILSSGLPVLFVQERMGYKGRTFKMYKFRTMVVGADEKQRKLLSKNEADGPVFKIWDDPRFTGLGKVLSHSGLDELPQLWNVCRGEMEIVGPRPLPVAEARQIDKKYRVVRESVRPGIISPWIFEGYHGLDFESWMEEDKRYVRNKSWLGDIWLIVKGVGLLGKLILKECIVLIKQR